MFIVAEALREFIEEELKELGKYGDLRLSMSDVEGVEIKVTLLDI